MRRLIYLRHNGGQLANQLWGYISVYACALEIGIPCENWAFFEYARFFSLPPVSDPFIRLLYRAYDTLLRILPERHVKRFLRKVYGAYIRIRYLSGSHAVVQSGDSPSLHGPYYLPPDTRAAALPAVPDGQDLYFSGWMFRNPAGLTKYRDAVRTLLSPKPALLAAARAPLTSVRAPGVKRIIGLHIRQTDFKTFKNGLYYVPPERFAAAARAIAETHPGTAFLVCSDAPVDLSLFSGLRCAQGNAGLIGDLFSLSACDAVVGTNSTFGTLAAYLGNVPHFVLTDASVDWQAVLSQRTFEFHDSSIVGF